jgi:hypothetical protein
MIMIPAEAIPRRVAAIVGILKKDQSPIFFIITCFQTATLILINTASRLSATDMACDSQKRILHFFVDRLDGVCFPAAWRDATPRVVTP